MKPVLNLNNKNFNKVMIDTSSLMQQSSFVTLMKETIIPELSKSGMKLTVPQAVMRELRKFIQENSPRALTAQKALEGINALSKVGYIAFEGNPNSEERPDSYMMREVVRAKMEQEKVLVISQDYQLALDLMSLNQIRSTITPACNVKRINANGELENFNLTIAPKTEQKQYSNIQNVLKRFGIQ